MCVCMRLKYISNISQCANQYIILLSHFQSRRQIWTLEIKGMRIFKHWSKSPTSYFIGMFSNQSLQSQLNVWLTQKILLTRALENYVNTYKS